MSVYPDYVLGGVVPSTEIVSVEAACAHFPEFGMSGISGFNNVLDNVASSAEVSKDLRQSIDTFGIFITTVREPGEREGTWTWYSGPYVEGPGQ
jgi:hypothetical protein